MQNINVTGRCKPTTIKGYYKAKKRAGEELPSLKAFARMIINQPYVRPQEVVADAKRWLASKRPGGTDEQRAERKAHRKERQSRNAMAKAAKKAAKGGGKSKKKSRGDD